jgi:hypothetical protein
MFVLPKVPKPTKDALLGILPHAATIDKNDIGLRDLFRYAVTLAVHDAHHHFRVGDVHLTAICLYVYVLYSSHGRNDESYSLKYNHKLTDSQAFFPH